jgi:hypothetical protein
LIEGDFFDAELGHGYDVALGLLRPGGMIIVQDYLRTGRSPDQVRIDKLENLYVKVVVGCQPKWDRLLIETLS